MVRKISGFGVSSGGMEISGVRETEASVSVGRADGGGDAVRKRPVGGVGRRVGMAGDGVRRCEPTIRW